MKKSKKNKQLSKSNSEIKLESPLIKIGSVDDHILKATVSVRGKRVYINIDGFLNEFDATLWAKQQNVLWNRELEHYLDSPPSSPTLH